MTRPGGRNLRAGFVWGAVLLAAVAGQGADPGSPNARSDGPAPVPALSPGEVVRIQLEALRRGEGRNGGFEIAFRFASPANRARTGPLPRFIGMIRNGPYALMTEYLAADFGPVEERGTKARQRVVLTDHTTSVAYWFHLSLQSESPYVDCWMTDAVYVEPVNGRST